MNGVHDLGGAQGFGAVAPEADEPVFHAEWEARVFAMNVALGLWNIDVSRHALERIAPARYLASSYYARWLEGIETLLVEGGHATAEELAAGRAASQAREEAPLAAVDVPAAVAKRRRYDRDGAPGPVFAPGDLVRARVMAPAGHVRLPRYVRGRVGEVAMLHGAHVLPDANAAGLGERPEPLYAVRFDAEALWGPEAEPGATVTVDAWQSYLEPA